MIQFCGLSVIFRANIKKLSEGSKMRTGCFRGTRPMRISTHHLAAISSQGNGREWGEIGFDEFLEYKSVLGSEIKNRLEIGMATVNPPLEPISQSPIPTPPLPWHTRVFYGRALWPLVSNPTASIITSWRFTARLWAWIPDWLGWLCLYRCFLMR